MFSNSNFKELVDFTFIYITAISVGLLLLISFLMIFFVVKFNRKKNPKAVNIKENTVLEILWTAIPVILVLSMFWFGWIGYVDFSNPPKDSIKIKATAQMWKWSFEYDNGLKSDSLIIPQNKPVEIKLNSLDVNHSLYIPALRIKQDVIPNRNNSVWFKSVNEGTFDIACAEYCGLNHSYMYTKLVVLSQKKYENWFYSNMNLKQQMNSLQIDTTKK